METTMYTKQHGIERVRRAKQDIGTQLSEASS